MSSALLILERNEQILSLLYQENRLVQVKVHEKREDNTSTPVVIPKNNESITPNIVVVAPTEESALSPAN